MQTTFTEFFSIDSGQVTPNVETLVSGNYAFVLGSTTAREVTIVRGDFVEVSQSGASLGNLGRMMVSLRAVPSEEHWRFDVIVNDVVFRSVDIDRDRDLKDIAWPSSATDEIRFRLTLVDDLGTSAIVTTPVPAAYLTAISYEDLGSGDYLINRDPEPGESNVAVDSPIAYTLINITTGTPNDFFEFLLNGELVVSDDQGDADGWTHGAVSSADFTQLRVTGEHSTNFDSNAEFQVDVRFYNPSADGSMRPQNPTWSFTTIDLSDVLTEVKGIGATKIRVLFSRDMDASTLGVSAWFLEHSEGLPAVVPSISSVTSVSMREFVLNLDQAQTPGVTYKITLTGAEDTRGFSAGTLVEEFSGFTPVIPEGRVFELIELLPAMNLTEDLTEDLQKFVACFQEVTNLLLSEIDAWTDILDPDLAEERFVEAMLLDLGNPFDFELSEIDKRRLAKLLVPIYRQKGTDAGIINAIRFFLGIETTITTPAFTNVWRLGISTLGVDSYLGTTDLRSRLSFQINVTEAITDEQETLILKLANYMKDARTHVIGVVQPYVPTEPNHMELGLSRLGVDWYLH